MGQRIKVTGYLDPEELDPVHVDLDHSMGLSNEGFESLTGADGEGGAISLGSLEDVDFELVSDD